MRILLLENLVYLPSHGGANKSNRLLLEALAARGHACRAVALATAAQGSRTREQFLDELARRGIPIVATAPGVDLFHAGGVEVDAVSDPARFLPVAEARARDFAPDLILITCAGPAEPLLELAAAAGPPFVYLAHTTLWLPFGPASFRPSPREAALLAQAAAVVTVSRFLAQYLERWGGLRAEVLHFPVYGEGPFPDLARFDAGFVTLVNPAAVKGVSIFLELAARLPEVPFAAVPTYRSTRAEEEALAALPNVHRLAAEDDVERIFERARALLMPSLWDEAFGVIAVEAMLRGIPVLASDTGGLAEAKLGVDYVLPVRRIERYQARLDDRGGPVAEVPAQDLGPWMAALGELLGDRERYRRLSAASREAAHAFVAGLSWDPFEELFARLAGRSTRESRGARPAGGSSPDALSERLARLSPEQRSLVALRLWRRAGGPGPATASPLVAIEPAGEKPPIFLVHPVAGTVDCYVPLSRHLGPGRPLWAFRAAGLAGLVGEEEPEDNLERMAARYVAALRGRQERRPYLLGGWSFGALVAFEMARQLADAGEEVALLALVDCTAPLPGWRGEGFDPEIGDRELIDLWARELAGGGAAEAKEEVPERSPEERTALVLAELRRLRLLPATAGLAELQRGLRVYRAHRRALRGYEPGLYGGPVALFRTATVGAIDEPAWGWATLATGKLDVHVLPGTHYTLLAEPHVRELAAALEKAAESCGSQPSGSGREMP
jgi:thioesterase domain-containing protein/glycosyltransferase involved in cell wall biosynthesis